LGAAGPRPDIQAEHQDRAERSGKRREREDKNKQPHAKGLATHLEAQVGTNGSSEAPTPTANAVPPLPRKSSTPVTALHEDLGNCVVNGMNKSEVDLVKAQLNWAEDEYDMLAADFPPPTIGSSSKPRDGPEKTSQTDAPERAVRHNDRSTSASTPETYAEASMGSWQPEVHPPSHKSLPQASGDGRPVSPENSTPRLADTRGKMPFQALVPAYFPNEEEWHMVGRKGKVVKTPEPGGALAKKSSRRHSRDGKPNGG
jgi:hypothetical protein